MAIEKEEVLLPEDALMDILSRLPVKSLLRFKSVCKCWYALIQNPIFIAFHLNSRSPQNKGDCLFLRFFYCRLISDDTKICRSLVPNPITDDHEYKIEFALSFVPNDNEAPINDLDVSFTGLQVGDIRYVGSCNGLLCISVGVSAATIVICNPANREFRVLPKPPHYEKKHRWMSHFGFGFDPKANDYKVVRFAFTYYGPPDVDDYNPPPEQGDPFVEEGLYDYDDDYFAPYVHQKFQIYEMSTDSWRKIDPDVSEDLGHCENFTAGVAVCDTSFDGAFYWLAPSKTNGRRGSIMAFHMVHEVFEEIPLPDSPDVELRDLSSICVLKDSLALLDRTNCDYFSTVCFDLWVMDDEEYGSGGVQEHSWTKKYTIGPLLGRYYDALAFLQNGELLLMSSYSGDRSQMMSYNFMTQNVKEDYRQACGRPEPEGVLQVLPYIESLISVNRKVDSTIEWFKSGGLFLLDT